MYKQINDKRFLLLKCWIKAYQVGRALWWKKFMDIKTTKGTIQLMFYLAASLNSIMMDLRSYIPL